jgi:flagellar protein FliS
MSYAAKAYATTKSNTDVMASNSPELILVVFDRLFDHLKSGKAELEAGGYGIEYFSKASDLISLGLVIALDKEKGGEIARNLDAIYRWSLNTILQARLKKSPELIQEVINVLTPVYQGWMAINPHRTSSHLYELGI